MGKGFLISGRREGQRLVKDGVVVGTTPLYIIGVDAGKERIYSGLKRENEETHRYHFPKNEGKGYDSNFFNGLLSETMVSKITAKGVVWAWKKLVGIIGTRRLTAEIMRMPHIGR